MKIKLNNVRLSFPSLFKTETYAGQDTEKYGATFILDKTEHAEAIKAIKGEINRIVNEELRSKVPSDKICLKDGDTLGRDEYEGKFTIKAAGKKRPLVINRDRSPLTEEDGVIYAGCYVNAIIRIWAQNNQWGKRINASLEGVQFLKDGEAFSVGGASVDDFEEFDAFADDDNF